MKGEIIVLNSITQVTGKQTDALQYRKAAYQCEAAKEQTNHQALLS
ncbi:hypothetical protein GCM10007932_51160 [Vibrio penaeicida]|uniref:Uncharacterized protein n=1 Tax=Vibrio penaeicida TaxID=104609 RepID=A0AAV5NZG8_9VIBR|nr:hypothetical protein GCM10007932_51160 [Vibrio penaeicida]